MKKNTKIDFTGLDVEIDIEAAKSYVEHRINKGKPLTQRAFDQAMKKSLQAHEVGMTPTELIDWTVDKGWDGINLNYTKNAINNEMKASMGVGYGQSRQDNIGNTNIFDDEEFRKEVGRRISQRSNQ